mmetsp:Transcript_37988/g.108943  ORF Transcript_37988/g.108943 Transcript_37988/m.108943 type:complete len:264 (+) Transcript_37988:805-1596(+)
MPPRGHRCGHPVQRRFAGCARGGCSREGARPGRRQIWCPAARLLPSAPGLDALRARTGARRRGHLGYTALRLRGPRLERGLAHGLLDRRRGALGARGLRRHRRRCLLPVGARRTQSLQLRPAGLGAIGVGPARALAGGRLGGGLARGAGGGGAGLGEGRGGDAGAVGQSRGCSREPLGHVGRGRPPMGLHSLACVHGARSSDQCLVPEQRQASARARAWQLVFVRVEAVPSQAGAYARGAEDHGAEVVVEDVPALGGPRARRR